MNYSTCRIGQLNRCNSTGCEWKKVFQGYCQLTPTNVETNFRKSKEKEFKTIEKIKILNTPILVKEITAENIFQLPKQDDWIKKIKVKL